jgi:hypothetical protein
LKTRTVVLREALDQHPAVAAWRALNGRTEMPSAVEVLKRWQHKSGVYRLRDVGPAGAAVIAKKMRPEDASREIRFYRHVLPALHVSRVAYYGDVVGPDGTAWLFLEDAGDERYDPSIMEHRMLAVQWLASLHTSQCGTLDIRAAGPAYFHGVLTQARKDLLSGLRHPSLTDTEADALRSIVSLLDVVDDTWSVVNHVCAQVPVTVVHGDFASKNVRLVSRHDRRDLVVFDWETVGIGPPAADLAVLHRSEDRQRYVSLMRYVWPSLQEQDADGLYQVGRLMRLLHAIGWETMSYSDSWVGRANERMAVYAQRLGELLREDVWRHS